MAAARENLRLFSLPSRVYQDAKISALGTLVSLGRRDEFITRHVTPCPFPIQLLPRDSILLQSLSITHTLFM
jgi:hypothetical protein